MLPRVDAGEDSATTDSRNQIRAIGRGCQGRSLSNWGARDFPTGPRVATGEDAASDLSRH